MDELAPDWLIARVRHDPSSLPGLVVPGSTPVVCFGDQRSARVATLGINPSFREFVDSDKRLLTGTKRRLETLESLGAERLSELNDEQVRRLLDGCYDYFQHNPLDWFDALGPVLDQVGASYKARSACHLDLVQWATSKAWKDRGLEEAHRRALLSEDAPFLIKQLTWDRPGAGPLELVLVNGDTCYKQCKAVGVRWSEPDRQVFEGKPATFWWAKWHGVRLLCWSTNLAYGATPAVLIEAVPRHARALLEDLGWLPSTAKAAEPRPQAVAVKPIVVPVGPAVAGLVDDLRNHEADFDIDVQAGAVALSPAGAKAPVVFLDAAGVTLALPRDEAARLLALVPADDLGPDAIPGRQRVLISARAYARGQVRGQVLIFALRALWAGKELGNDQPVAADELVDAIVQSARFRQWPADMAAYWRLRREVLTELLTAALPPDPPAPSERPWRSAEADRAELIKLLEYAAADRLEGTAPHRRYMEAPEVFLEIPNLQTHNDRFGDLDDQVDEARHAFMLDVLERAYPGISDAHTTTGELLKRGVQPLPPRDEMQIIQDGDF